MANSRALITILVVLAIFELSFAGSSTNFPVKPLSNRVQLKKDIFNQVNNPPSLEAKTYSVWENSKPHCFNVLDDTFDIDGNYEKTTLAIFSIPANGWAEVSGLKVCYVPDEYFNGMDNFRISVCDNTSRCSWAEIRINVLPINQAPTAKDDFVVLGEKDYTVSINVLENDFDVDGVYVDYHSLKVVEGPHGGVATVTGNHRITYTPTFNQKQRFVGDDCFIYQICDADKRELCSYAKVHITVLDKCLACEKCESYIDTFNLHASWLEGYYQVDVINADYADDDDDHNDDDEDEQLFGGI